MDLSVRLQILQDAGQLSEANHRAIAGIIAMLADDWNIELTEENGAMFVTHLAIALERIAKGEPVKPVEEYVLAELKSQDCFGSCRRALAGIAAIVGREFPEEEEGYVLIHLCTLFAKEAQR